MDLLAITRALKRHWRWTVPIAIVVAVAAAYVALTTPTTYQATASYVLFSPPAAPTPDDIAANPLLGLVHANNPYARMDQSVVVGITAKRVNTDPTRSKLVAAGADPGYKVTTGGLYGATSPTADVKGTGDTPATAIETAKIVGAEFQRNLHELQVAQGVDDTYMVRAEQVDAPLTATAKVSSRLRAIVAVLALGALLLFVVVSIGEAVDNHRRERAERRSQFLLPPAVDDMYCADQDGWFHPAVPGSRIATPANGTNGGRRRQST
jgi:hypothetical protein